MAYLVCTDFVFPAAQGLRAEIGRGVDQHVVALVADQDGGPQAVVARVAGRAHGAMAADGGHAHTGSRAQHGDLERRRRHSGFLSRRFGHVVGHLYEAETQFGEGILQQAMFFEREIALGLFQQNRHQVDGVAGKLEIGLGLFLFAEVHQAELHFSLRAQGKHDKRERRRRHGDLGLPPARAGWGRCRSSASF